MPNGLGQAHIRGALRDNRIGNNRLFRAAIRSPTLPQNEIGA